MNTEIIDIHTHKVPSNASQAIVNVIVGEGSLPAEARYLSAGIHPWHLSSADRDNLMDKLKLSLCDERVVAIGEAGIDKLCSTPLELQRELFAMQAQMAESRGLPLIIHAVRSHAEVVAMHERMRLSVPWIVHGFRGKPELARQYLSKGIYLSFGARYNPASLAVAYAAGALLVETDEASTDIEEIYHDVATSLGATASELKLSVRQNVERLFFWRVKSC